MANDPEPKNPEPMLRLNSNDHLLPGAHEKEPGGSMRSAGHLALYLSAHKSLVRVSQTRGEAVTQVEHVRAANLDGDMRLWIYPTDALDPDRIRLVRYKSKMTANLSKVLKSWKLALPTGQQRWYDLHIDPQSPVGPALVLRMDKPLETKWTTVAARPRKDRRRLSRPGSAVKARDIFLPRISTDL